MGPRSGKSKRRNATSSSKSSADITQIPSAVLPSFLRDRDTRLVDFVVYDTRPVPDDNIEQVAEQVMTDALREAQEGSAGERRTYGNYAGLRLLEEHAAQHRINQALEGKLQALDRDFAARDEKNSMEITKLQDMMQTMKGDIQQLKHASIGYRKIRHRFLDTFYRDTFQYIGQEGFDRIEEGNRAAHGGDLITDVGLYASGQRTNDTPLLQLYGLPWPKLHALVQDDNTLAISALNDHATWRAKKPNQDLPVEVSTTFQTLVQELERDPKEDISDGTTPLSRAYYAYRLACRSNSHLL